MASEAQIEAAARAMANEAGFNPDCMITSYQPMVIAGQQCGFISDGRPLWTQYVPGLAAAIDAAIAVAAAKE